MRRLTRLILAFGLLVAVSRVASAQSPPSTSGIASGMVQAYSQASQAWLARGADVARNLFTLLLALELVVTIIAFLLRIMRPYLATTFTKVIYLGLFFLFITAFPLFLPKIVEGFQAAGEQVVGLGDLSPSRIIDLGILDASFVLFATQGKGLFTNLAGVFFGVPVALLFLFAYVAIAARVVEVMLKSLLIVTGGIVFLGFAASRWTVQITENFVIAVIRTGIHTFLLYTVVGFGLQLSYGWTLQLATYQDFTTDGFAPFLEILGGVLLFAYVAAKVPAELAYALTAPSGFLRLREALVGEESAA